MKKKVDRPILRLFSLVVFFSGIIGILVNIATPFVYVFTNGITLLNIILAFVIWALFDFLFLLVIIVGILMWNNTMSNL